MPFHHHERQIRQAVLLGEAHFGDFGVRGVQTGEQRNDQRQQPHETPPIRAVVPRRLPSILTLKAGNDKEMGTQSYNAAVDMVDRNVAEGRAAKTAFIDPARKLTYGELADGVARIGPMLARLGLQREDRVAMMMLDTVDFPVLFWGAIRVGIVPVPLNTLLTAEQYRYILKDSRAKVLFVSAPLLGIAQQAAAGLNLKTFVVGDADGLPRFDQLLAAETKGAEPVSTSTDEVAFWLYSSGSTGMPKGVRHVHSSADGDREALRAGVLGIREDDVVYSAAKLFFAYGLGNGMSFPMSVGATAVLLPDRPTPQAVFAVIKREQPTIFYGVPTLYAAMLATRHAAGELGSDAAAHLRLGR